MPPRKAAETPTGTLVDGLVTPTPEPVAPGPIHLEVRINGKIKFLQRVHSYEIDQQHDKAVITGVLRPAPVEESE